MEGTSREISSVEVMAEVSLVAPVPATEFKVRKLANTYDMSTPFQTDASRPSALPSANIGARSYEQPPAESSEVYLDQVEEEWNKKVDTEVDTLVDGMVDLVAIASVGDKDKYQIALESFQAQCRAESMVRAASSLMSITHSLKLLLLLSDEAQIVRQHNEELRTATKEGQQCRQEVAHLLDELLLRSTSDNPTESKDTA